MIAARFEPRMRQMHLVREDAGERLVWRLPEPRWIEAVDALIGQLNEVEVASEADVAACSGLHAEYTKMLGAGMFGPSPYWEQFAALARREAVRVGSYVIWLTSLHAALEAQRQFLTALLDAGAGVQVRRGPPLDEDVKVLRDKVYAHPAYAAPRTEDDALAIATSLHLLAGQDGSWDDGGIRVTFDTAVDPGEEPSSVTWLRGRAKWKGSGPLIHAMSGGPISVHRFAQVAAQLAEEWLEVMVDASEKLVAMTHAQVEVGLRATVGLSVPISEVIRLPARRG